MQSPKDLHIQEIIDSIVWKNSTPMNCRPDVINYRGIMRDVEMLEIEATLKREIIDTIKKQVRCCSDVPEKCHHW
jgi:hypothetical protein